jgi:hypothetical protein
LDSFNKLDIKCYKLSNKDHKNERVEFLDNSNTRKSESHNQILPNSVRSSSDDLWNDFRSYLGNEKHSQFSNRDKIRLLNDFILYY